MTGSSPDLLGRRIELDGHFGIVKYIGPVGSSRDTWLGIDWDEPERGRHNGTHNGVQYFKAAQATSASFVKASRVNAGIGLLEGIIQRYTAPTDDFCGLSQAELAFEGDHNRDAKPIELFGMVKTAQRISQLATLQSVLLTGVPVAFCSTEDASELSSRLPSLTELDLSLTLFHDWVELARVAKALPNLRVLNLSQNVLASPVGFVPDPADSFGSLESLVLNKVGLDWPECLTLWRLAPKLRRLALSHNAISAVTGDLPEHAANLLELDLAFNPLDSNCMAGLSCRLPSLKLLNLAGCQLTEFSLPDEAQAPFPSLESLALSGNRLADWASVSQLHRLPKLSSLILLDNPLWTAQDEATSRQLAIARLPRLRLLNRSRIERDERFGAEIDYLKRHYAQYRDLTAAGGDPEAAAKFKRLHPSLPVLLDKLGAPDEAEMAGTAARALKDSVLEVRLRCKRADTGEQADGSHEAPAGRMLVQHLIAFIRKAFRLPPTAHVELFYLCDNMPGIEYPMEVETREVLYYNIASGDTILAKYS
uniref:Tubulin-specific chaperone E n=1 Tax=Macrostomum lignano TaxID=282301 RepID=A0A1I8JFQ0_9PLAT